MSVGSGTCASNSRSTCCQRQAERTIPTHAATMATPSRSVVSSGCVSGRCSPCRSGTRVNRIDQEQRRSAPRRSATFHPAPERRTAAGSAGIRDPAYVARAVRTSRVAWRGRADSRDACADAHHDERRRRARGRGAGRGTGPRCWCTASGARRRTSPTTSGARARPHRRDVRSSWPRRRATSRPTRRPTRSTGCVADTLAVADAAGLDRFRLLGHSMGGMVARTDRDRASRDASTRS